MKFLKQGLCLALLGAGLAAVPATLASQASASPASSSRSTRPQPRTRHPQHRQRQRLDRRPAGHRSGRLRPGRGRRRPPARRCRHGQGRGGRQGRHVPRQLRRCLRCRPGRAHAQRHRRRLGGWLHRLLHPVLQGHPCLRRAPQGARQRRRRPDLRQRVRRAGHRRVHRARGCPRPRPPARAVALVKTSPAMASNGGTREGPGPAGRQQPAHGLPDGRHQGRRG